MALVACLRAVNVGRHQRFLPSEVARELAPLAAVNVGAAGTFVFPGSVSERTVRQALLARLGFPAELMVCRGEDLLALVDRDPPAHGPLPADVKRFVSVLAGAPERRPPLPVEHPAEGPWEVRLVDVAGPFALALHRRLGRYPVDLNAVVEKAFGVRATSRNWNTMLKVAAVLRDAGGGEAPARKGAPRRGVRR